MDEGIHRESCEEPKPCSDHSTRLHLQILRERVYHVLSERFTKPNIHRASEGADNWPKRCSEKIHGILWDGENIRKKKHGRHREILSQARGIAMSEVTTQKLAKTTLERVKKYGKMGDTFDDALSRILDILESS